MSKNLDEIKSVSIKEYLERIGFSFQQNNNLFFCKSPFSPDKTWSFCWYPNTNSFYDWSQGFGGTIIDLVFRLNNSSISEAIHHISKGEYQPYRPDYKVLKSNPNFYDFEYTKYLNTNEEEIEEIKKYARSRNIIAGYEYGVYFTVGVDKTWVRHPAIMFLHRDENLKPCGAKFRKLPNDVSLEKDNGVRFTSRGKMGVYMLEYNDPENYGESTGYLVEGEGNANSLWQYLIDIKRNCIVISTGGVGQLPRKLPDKFNQLTDKRLIIDFDGNEELFQMRLNQYNNYALSPIKIKLNKGEDINWLYSNKKMELIQNLLL